MDLSVKNNSTNFKAGYHLYFYTTDGKRIVSDENMKKCLHYVEAHLNNAKKVQGGKRNMDLVDTLRFGQFDKNGNRIGGDKDYFNNPIVRSVIDKTKDKIQGFINIATGDTAKFINEHYGKKIGKAKGVSKQRTGSTKSFETSYSVNNYIEKAPDYAESKAVYRDGKRVALGVAFTPIFNKNGKLKNFEYHHAGFFDESLVNSGTK